MTFVIFSRFRHFFLKQNIFLHFWRQHIPQALHFTFFLSISNIEMTNLLSLNIFTVLKVCWMTALAAAIVLIKPLVIVSLG